MSPKHTILCLSILFIIYSIPKSLSQQNIQTYYPLSSSPPPPPPILRPPPAPENTPATPFPAPENPSPARKSSTKSAVGKAVGATAAATLVLSGLLFFFLLRNSRRKRDGETANVAGITTNPSMPRANDFTRFNGNLKGVIVDENGLDVLYWRNLQEGEKNRESFKKRGYGNLKDEEKDEEKEEEKRIIGEMRKDNSPIQEVPLLRGRSSTSQSDVWGEKTIKKSPTLVKVDEKQDSSIELMKIAKQTVPTPPIPPPPAAIENKGFAPPPPPPPGGGAPAIFLKPPAPPKRVPNKRSSSDGEGTSSNGNGGVKMKPLHWDKVNPNVEHSMVWDKMDKGSFKFDGDMMEALFGYVATNRKSPKGDDRSSSPLGDKSGPPSQIFILDTRKSQNTAIILKSLGISRKEIIDALLEGKGLNADSLEKLTKIAPTDEETSQILEFDGDPTRLADAESFLYHLLKSIPSAFTRFDAMLFRSNFNLEISHVKESLQSLESACNELRIRGLFLKLLEAVLKAGNRLNAGTSRGNAQAFNLTALRKLSDVKSSDGKTTLLQFVVQEVVRAEGKRFVLNKNRSLSRSSSQSGNYENQTSDKELSKDDREREYMMLGLPVVGGLSAEFSNVKKAATLDYDVLVKTTSLLSSQVVEIRKIVAKCGPDGGFSREMKGFLDTAESEIKAVNEEQTRVLEIVRKTSDYYQSGFSKDKGANALQLFVIVKDFLGMVDQVCIEIARNSQKRKPSSSPSSSTSSVGGSSSLSPGRVFRFPKLPANFMSDSSKSDSNDSDDESEGRGSIKVEGI